MSDIPRILRLKEVMARTSIKRSTIYEWMDRGIFPKTIPLGGRAVGWLESDINAWIEERANAAKYAA